MSEVFDADIDAWLKHWAAEPSAADATMTGVRQHARITNAAARWRLRLAATTEHDVSAGGVPARVFWPTEGEVAGTLVYFHGGGWILGGIDTHLHHARRLAVEAGVVVVSVDYRLAPEHPFPAAYDDCLAATRWAADSLGELGGATAGLVVGGDSAGAQLAASVAIACRDTGLDLAAQLLVVPVVDGRGAYADRARNAEFPSRESNATGYGLLLTTMGAFVEHYAPTSADDWRVSPILARSSAGSLAGLAPAIVHTAGFDVLRDEGRAYADALSAAGTPVTFRTWPTLNHSFLGLGGVSAAADAAAAQVSADVRAALS
ncbi:MAG: alpha/beta hydrolase [Nocardioides sp.]|nr:alpha/beta hydrolase [Nocardioides sp.]